MNLANESDRALSVKDLKVDNDATGLRKLFLHQKGIDLAKTVTQNRLSRGQHQSNLEFALSRNNKAP